MFQISGIGFPMGLLDTNLHIAYLDLERCNEVSQNRGRLPNLLSRTGFQVEAIQNLAKLRSKELR